MSDPINFDIEGLVARYELHPDRRDVFVEAEADQGLIKTYLEVHGAKDVSVFSIAVVDVPAHIQLQRSLPHPSRRSEVITLAFELAQRGVSPRQVACIADADFQYLFPENLVCSLLLLTDYASMEMYAFSDDIVGTVIVMVAPAAGLTGAKLIADLTGPLQFLFSVRAVNFTLQSRLQWIDAVEKFFSFEDGRMEFDESEFMKRYLIDRVRAELAAAFQQKLQEVQDLLSSNVRCRIRGHDFVRILTWYLRRVEKCTHLNEASVRQLLYVTMRPADLAAQPMFASLLERMAG